MMPFVLPPLEVKVLQQVSCYGTFRCVSEYLWHELWGERVLDFNRLPGNIFCLSTSQKSCQGTFLTALGISMAQ